MSKKIKIKLDNSSIQSAIKELENYKRKLEDNNEEFVKQLLRDGQKEANTILGTVPSTVSTDHYTDTIANTSGDKCNGYLNLIGSQVAFVEFSAGVTFGTMPGGYPLPSGAGMGIGTYNPGSDNAWSPDGWAYMDSSGIVQKTYGNPAYMPMYYASQKMQKDAGKIAKGIFST